MKKAILGAVAIACATTAPANAAVDITIEGGGSPVIFEENGNRFVLLGIDARRVDGNTIVNQPDFTVDANYVRSLILSGPNLVNLFSCTGGQPCTPNASITVSDEDRLFDSLIGEFQGTDTIVLASPSGGTTTIGAGITRQGPPPISTAAAVPEPATWMMLLLGFFAIGAAMRVKVASARSSLRAA